MSQLTKDESKHVWQRSRCIVYNVELAGLEKSIPDARSCSKDFLDASSKCDERECIAQAQHTPH